MLNKELVNCIYRNLKYEVLFMRIWNQSQSEDVNKKKKKTNALNKFAWTSQHCVIIFDNEPILLCKALCIIYI